LKMYRRCWPFLSFPQGICVLLEPVRSIPAGEML
jgi:hypothetical protein